MNSARRNWNVEKRSFCNKKTRYCPMELASSSLFMCETHGSSHQNSSGCSLQVYCEDVSKYKYIDWILLWRFLNRSAWRRFAWLDKTYEHRWAYSMWRMKRGKFFSGEDEESRKNLFLLLNQCATMQTSRWNFWSKYNMAYKPLSSFEGFHYVTGSSWCLSVDGKLKEREGSI